MLLCANMLRHTSPTTFMLSALKLSKKPNLTYKDQMNFSRINCALLRNTLFKSFLSIPVHILPLIWWHKVHSSFLMRRVCLLMFMVVRSVEQLSTSRASSWRSSSVSASRARVFSCWSIYTKKAHKITMQIINIWGRCPKCVNVIKVTISLIYFAALRKYHISLNIIPLTQSTV